MDTGTGDVGTQKRGYFYTRPVPSAHLGVLNSLQFITICPVFCYSLLSSCPEDLGHLELFQIRAPMPGRERVQRPESVNSASRHEGTGNAAATDGPEAFTDEMAEIAKNEWRWVRCMGDVPSLCSR